MEYKHRASFRLGDVSFDIESTNLNWLKNKEKESMMLLDKAVFSMKSMTGNKPARNAVLPQNLTVNKFCKET